MKPKGEEVMRRNAWVARLAGAVLLCFAPAACSPAQEQEPAYQPPPPTVASVDQSAFARFSTGEESGEQDAEAADVNVNLPVLGMRAPAPEDGQEAGEEIEQAYAADDTRNWYAQVSRTSEGQIIVRGSLLRDTTQSGFARGEAPTIDNPLVTLGGDEAEDEAHAEFVLGNVSYSVTLYCEPDQLEACADEARVREIVGGLDMFSQESRQ